MEMGRLVDGIKDRLGDKIEARADVRTGSILVQHPHLGIDDITAILEDLGVILEEVVDVDIPAPGGKTEIASNIANAISDLNDRVGLATNGILNLRVLVPLGFGALAVVQLIRRGLQIEAAPWYLLAYAAFDSFVKLHRAPHAGGDGTGAETGATVKNFLQERPVP
jgi:hypothetical protein